MIMLMSCGGTPIDKSARSASITFSLDENNEMRYSVRHCPPSLALLPAESIDDYNSINYMRARSDSAKSARLSRGGSVVLACRET